MSSAFYYNAGLLINRQHPISNTFYLVWPMGYIDDSYVLIFQFPNNGKKLIRLLCRQRSCGLIQDLQSRSALLLSSEENRIIITYEDKLYKISLTDIRQYLVDNSFMNSQFAFAWKDSEHNNVINPFINFISQVDWGTRGS